MKLSLLVLLIFLLHAPFQKIMGQIHDSIPDTESSIGKIFRVDGFTAASFLLSNNWKSTEYSVLTFAGSLNLKYKINSEGMKRIHELRTELSYQKFIDSVWIKTADNLMLTNNWIINGSRSLRNSFSLSLKTQITDTWENSDSGKPSKWKSGPLLPASLTAGYGMIFMFWKQSFLDFSFAALKIISIPRNENKPEEIKSFAKTDKAFFNSEYGFNFQSSIEKYFFKNIKWENRTTFFAKNLEKESLNLDMQNSLSLFPARFIKIRFEIKTAYNFIISSKMQYRYEVLAGYYFSY